MGRFNQMIGKRAPWIVVAIYIACFFWLKNPSDPWDRVINSDGKGYYAYLPGLFIYHDLSFSFIDNYESTYYPRGGDLYKDFRVKFNHGIADKYFPGLAVLWLPFFLAGHVIALISGFPADGYSMPYQLAIAFSALVYLFLGLVLLKKILYRYYSNKTIVGWIVILTGLATNLIYYTIVEGSMVHVYNFFLVNAFILLVLNLAERPDRRIFAFSAAVFGLIVITRPQNGIIILSVPFLAGSLANFRKLVFSLFGKPANLLSSILAVLLVLAIPMIIWYQQTGRILVYTYGNEHFNFLAPQLGKFLFGFEKGWLIYTPVAAISLLGFVNLYKSSKYRFITLAVFLSVLVYVLSCWWAWNYTSQHSQRVMIDFLAFVAILLVFLLGNISSGKWLTMTIAWFFLLIALNVMQLLQQIIWVYPRGPVTAKAYITNFFSFRPSGSYYIPGESVEMKQSFKTDYESVTEIFNNSVAREIKGSFSGNHCLEVDTINPVQVISRSMASERTSKPVLLKIGGMFLKNNSESGINISIEYGHDNAYYGQSELSVSHALQPGKWSYSEYVSYIPYLRSVSDSVFVTFLSTGGTIRADDLQVELLTMKEGTSYDWFGKPAEIINGSLSWKNDMESPSDDRWKGKDKVTSAEAFSGNKSCKIEAGAPYSVLFEDDPESYFNGSEGYIRVAARLKLSAGAKPVLVFDYRKGTETIKYKALAINGEGFGEAWILREFFDEMPVKRADKVRIYFWYTAGSQPCYIDDFEVEYVSYLPKRTVAEPEITSLKTTDYPLVVCNDFEGSAESVSSKVTRTGDAPSGDHATFFNDKSRFSYTIKVPLAINADQQSHGVLVTAALYSDNMYSNAAMVTDFRLKGASVSYNPLYLRGVNQKGKWVQIKNQSMLPAGTSADTVLVYFYLPHGEEELMADDICVRLLPLQTGKK